MKILIAGAGDVGYHLARLLANEAQDITLIDQDQQVLDYASSHLDVLTIHGDSSSIELLTDAKVKDADLVLTVTTSEKNNLMTAILAKQMGARQTIARISSDEYLTEENRARMKSLGVDNIISPSVLAAKEIQRLVKRCSFTDVFEFEQGKMNLVGVTLDHRSPLVDRKLKDMDLFDVNSSLRPIAVLRGHQTIIPRGDTYLHRNDHVYFITKYDCADDISTIVGKKEVTVNRIMILGGTRAGYDTAVLLENDYQVILVEKDRERCKHLASRLQKTLVINGAPNNIDLLEEEGLDQMDAVIALTENSEANIIACLTAKNHGVYKTIASVDNKEYVHISQNIGVDTLINQKLIAANNIFRFVRKGRIEAITSLQGVDAEIIEYTLHRNNQLTRKPLRQLHFPETALIGGVIRGDESLIPNGDTILQKDDKVIVFAQPEAISRLEKLFS